MSSVERTGTAGGPSARAIDLLKRIDYRLAETDAEKEAIYRLRYRAYLKEGAVDPNPTEMVSDRYDELANSWTIGVFVDGQLTSSLRITVGSGDNWNCPSMDVFPDLLEPELAKGKIIVDPTRFVADPLRANRWAELPYLTLRLANLACDHFKADIGLASVRAEHQAFYRRVFMSPVAAARDYPGLKKPIGLMSIDIPRLHEKVYVRYPFLRSTEAERQALFVRTRSDASPSLQPRLAGSAKTTPLALSNG